MSTPKSEANFVIGVIISIAFVVWSIYRTQRFWLPYVKLCYCAVITHLQYSARVLSFVVVLVGMGYAWHVLGDENAPHCPVEAYQTALETKCQPGDWMAVAVADVPRYCDFNKKMYQFDSSVVCRYAGKRLARPKPY